MSRSQFFHRALHQLLRIVEAFEHERDVHFRLARKSLASTVDAVLTHERERVGQEIERNGEASAGGAHHRLVRLERVAMFVEYRHKALSCRLSAIRYPLSAVSSLRALLKAES